MDAPVSSNNAGLYPLYPGIEPTVELIAIENSSDKPLDCWTFREPGKQGVLWLNHPDFLRKTLQQARIWSFNYHLQNFEPGVLGNTLLTLLAEHPICEVLILMKCPLTWSRTIDRLYFWHMDLAVMLSWRFRIVLSFIPANVTRSFSINRAMRAN